MTDDPQSWQGDPAETEAAGHPDPQTDDRPSWARPTTTRPPRKYPSGAAKRKAAAARSAGSGGTSTGSTGRPGAAPGPPRAKPASKPRAKARVDYTEGLNAWLNLFTLPLIAKKQWLDVAAIVVHGPPITQAASDLANDDPRIAAIVGKAAELGPYGQLASGLVTLAAQLGSNHKLIPEQVAGMAGALPPDVLLAAVNFTPPAAAPPGPGADGARSAAA